MFVWLVKWSTTDPRNLRMLTYLLNHYFSNKSYIFGFTKEFKSFEEKNGIKLPKYFFKKYNLEINERTNWSEFSLYLFTEHTLIRVATDSCFIEAIRVGAFQTTSNLSLPDPNQFFLNPTTTNSPQEQENLGICGTRDLRFLAASGGYGQVLGSWNLAPQLSYYELFKFIWAFLFRNWSRISLRVTRSNLKKQSGSRISLGLI